MNGPIDDNTLNQLAANFHNNVRTAVKAPAQAKAAPTGVKGFLINALPSIAGGAGLVGGELLDPFGGGIITGAAASGAGEALKERLLGQKVNAGQVAIQAGETAALGSVGKALSGARSGAKALLGVDQAKTAAPAADTLIQNAEQDAKPTIGQKLTNAVVNRGEQTQAKLGGFAPGQKVAGKQLNTVASNRIAQTLQNEGISALGAPEQLDQVGQKLTNLNKARAALIDSNNAPLTDEDHAALTQAVADRLSKTAGGTADNVQKHAATFLSEANDSEDVASLGKYKTSLDNNAINYNRNPASVEPGQALAAKAVRGSIKDMIEQKVPGIGDINARATGLSTAESALMNSSARVANLTTGAEGLWGRILSGELAEKGKSAAAKTAVKVGTALGGKGAIEPGALAVAGDTGVPAERGIAQEGAQKIAGAGAPPPTDLTGTTTTAEPVATTLPGTTQSAVQTPNSTLMGSLGKLIGVPKAVGKAITGRTIAPVLAKPGATASKTLLQLGGRGIGSAVSGVQPQQITPQPGAQQLGASSLDTTPGGATGGLPGTSDTSTGTADENSAYPEANMLYDIERDPKNASTYEALYKIINPAPSSSSLDNLTTNQKNQLTGSQNAIAALQGYTDQIQQLASGTQGPVGGSLSALLGKYGIGGQNAANAYALQSSAADVATQIAAGLSPTGRATASLITQVKESLPKVTDSPAAAQAKVSQLVSRLQAVMQTEATPLSSYVGSAAGGGDIGSSLQDLLQSTGQQ